ILKSIVAEWHKTALPFISTKDFAESWSDFQIAWQRVKKPYGQTIRAVYEQARLEPPNPVDGNRELGVLAAMCRLLCAGNSEFYLSCRTVEELFGITRMTAWRWLQCLQFYGVIAPLKKGTMNDHQATTWLYLGGAKGSNATQGGRIITA